MLFTSTNMFSQNLISVPFTNGFVGDNTANNVSSNSKYLTALGWSNVQFSQNSPTLQFIELAQGNDIPGTVLITDFLGIQYSIPGFIKWRTPSGNNITTPVFVPTTGATLATNSSNGSANYSITTNSYIGLTYNGQTLTIPNTSSGGTTAGDVTGNAATSGILDSLNSYLGSFSAISIIDYTVNEGAGTATVTVTLSASSANVITVAYTTSDGSTAVGLDYTATSGTITFAAGQTTRTFTIPIINDATIESNETINITLSDPTNASILDGAGVVTIVDNDTCTVGTPAGSVTVQPTCATTTGTIVFTTQSGVEYSIDGTTYQSSATFTGVAAGTYTLKVRSTTDNTCTATGATVTVSAVPSAPSSPIVSQTTICGDITNISSYVTVSSGHTINITSTRNNTPTISNVNAPDGQTLSTGIYTIGQSFTPLSSYDLSAVSFYATNANSSATLTVKIYSGNGSAGPLLATKSISNTVLGEIIFNLNNPVQLTQNQIYTFIVETNTSFSHTISWNNNGNPYSGGSYWRYGSNFSTSDIWFKIYKVASYQISQINTISSCESSAVTVTIIPSPSAGTLSGNQSVCFGSTTTFSSTVSGGAWTSSDITVATVNPSNGIITGVAAGTATITYTVTGTGGCADITATRTVTVTAPSTPAASVTVQPTCATTTGTIVFTTQSGVEYSIDGTTYQSSATFTGVTAGSYTIKVRSTTDNTCTATGAAVMLYDPICAITDTLGPINGYTGATTSSVLANDTLNGVIVIPSQVILTGLTVPTGLTLNADGTITIAPQTPAGTYNVIYRICETLNPTNCDTVTSTVIVGGCLDFAINDCDNDGETNGTENTNGTDPNNPCSYTNAPATSSAAYATWSVLDCDGDGTPNGLDTNPQDPCVFVAGSIPVVSNPIWANADCDNDGETNGTENTNGTDPNNPCSYTNAPATSSAAYATWSVLDCDGDGVINGTELADGTDVNNPCESINAHATALPSTSFLAGDCDGDGLSNEEEIGENPNVPNDSNGNGIPDYLEINNHNISDDDLEIFNAVTPNGNGDNDIFVIQNIQNYPNNTVTIFNRWGVVVYEIEGYGQNGKYFKGVSEGRITINKNEGLPIGTYFYVLRYVNNQGVSKERSGYLYLNK